MVRIENTNLPLAAKVTNSVGVSLIRVLLCFLQGQKWIWILPKFSVTPLLGSQLRLIPPSVLLKIKWYRNDILEFWCTADPSWKYHIIFDIFGKRILENFLQNTKINLKFGIVFNSSIAWTRTIAPVCYPRNPLDSLVHQLSIFSFNSSLHYSDSLKRFSKQIVTCFNGIQPSPKF